MDAEAVALGGAGSSCSYVNATYYGPELWQGNTVGGAELLYYCTFSKPVYTGLTYGYSYCGLNWWPYAVNSVTVIDADLVSNVVTVQLSGSSNAFGILTVTANGATNNYAAMTPANPVGPGTYKVAFARPNMPPDTYTSITANWGITPTPLSTKFTLRDSWLVLGVIRHSQYNTPVESQCSGGSGKAWIFDSYCQFTEVRLNHRFMRQVYINGTGKSISYGIIKYIDPARSPCASNYPAGATSRNTFMEVPSVTGACNTELTAGVSVATYPSPNLHSTFSCGDAILLATSANTNEAVKEADDYCPGCYKDFGGTLGHIDDYSSAQACTASRVGDLGDFWTANTHGERQ